MVEHKKINLTEEQHYHYELMFEKYLDSALELFNQSLEELENLEYHCLTKFDQTFNSNYIYIANFCRDIIDFKYTRKMKTIIVIYATNKETNSDLIKRYKHYAFNTNSDIKVGDLIKFSNSAKEKIQVVRVLEESFKFYNDKTGDLSNNYTSIAQHEIKELVIREDAQNVTYGSLIKEENDK